MPKETRSNNFSCLSLSRESFVSDFIGVGGFNLERNSIPFTYMTSVWPAVNCLTNWFFFVHIFMAFLVFNAINCQC